MQRYFNILLEFNQQVFIDTIDNAIKNNIKAYVCIIDGNVLAQSTKQDNYRNFINGAIVNSCDGDSIALLASLIHKKKFKSFTGPDIFASFIKKEYRFYFLGNTFELLKQLELKFVELGYDLSNFKFESLPYLNVECFDYKSIANNINEFAPDIIWVSLGAPKQEIFISYILPYINKGILFGIGAALNLYLGGKKNRRAPKWMIKLHLEWLFRVIKEPKRIGIRALNYCLILPRLIIQEIKQSNIN